MSFLIALGLALVLTPMAGRLGTAVGLVDRPGSALKIHQRPVPLLGGLAVTVAAILGAWLAGFHEDAGLLSAVGLLVAVGLIDDARPLAPYVQLAAQLAAGLLLVVGGARVHPLGELSAVAVVILVMVFANAVNMIDGQDGLAGGLAAIAAAGLAVLGGNEGLMLALSGALIAFLFWNRPPARIFLGNSGPSAIAVLLVAGLASASDNHRWPGLLAAALCLAMFAFELGFTVARRLAAGRLTEGDRLHSYDLLALELRSRTRVTLIFWAVGGVAAALGLLVLHLPVQVGGCVVALSVAVAAMSGLRLWRRHGGNPASVQPSAGSASSA